MKRTSKFLFLCLSLTLIAGAALGISVSATETEGNGQIDILAQNVVYGEKVSVAYAVDASVEDAVAGKVKVSYYLATEPSVVYRAELRDTTVSTNLYTVTDDNGTPDDTTDDTTVSYPVFATLGFAPQDFTDVVFAVAYTGDSVPEGATYKEYSVAEYLYSKLYKDGFINKTETDIGLDGKDYKRKVHYENMMAYGASAQDLIDGETETLITDYCYLFAADDTVTINGQKSGLFKPNTTVTLSTTAATGVSGYFLTTATEETSEVSASYVTVAGLAAKVTPDLGTAPVVTDFEAEGLTTPTSDYISNRVGSTVVADYTAQDSAVSNFTLADDPTGAANKVLNVTKVQAAGNVSTDVYASNEKQEGNCVTFEMKMYSEKVQFDRTYIYFTYSSSDEATTGTKTGFGLYFYQANGKEFRLQANNSNSTGVVTISTNLEGSSLPFDAWFTVKVEYYRDSHNAKVWIDDTCIVDGKCSNGFNAYDVFECVTITHDDERAGVDYFDDISVTLTDKEYVPETTTTE